MDKLSEVLNRFSIRAGVFHTGNVCGLSAFEKSPHQEGHLHVLKEGQAELQSVCATHKLSEPTLVFYPKPVSHRIVVNAEEGAELVCATITYGVNAENPLTSSLPTCIVIPLSDSENLDQTCRWLFDEAFIENQGKLVVMNRLCELLVIQLFRYIISKGDIAKGVFAGLNHPQVSKVLQAVHESPNENWSLDKMASIAGQSRSKFAELFRRVVDQTPADYVTDWRVGVSQDMLRQGKPIGVVANMVGYEDGSAFARVFRKKTGLSPKAWSKNVNH